MALGGEDSALTFRGGILLASVATTALVLVVVERPGRLRARARAAHPRGWVGRPQLRHLPVALAGLPRRRPGPAGRPGRHDLPADPALVRASSRSSLADLSYRFVETPVRRHGFAGSARRATARLRRLGTRGARIVWSVALVLVVALVAVLLTAPDRTSTEQLIAANEAELVDAAPSPAASARHPGRDHERPMPRRCRRCGRCPRAARSTRSATR